MYGRPPFPRSALKEREARALYAGFPPAREWRGGAWKRWSRLYSLDAHRVFTQSGKPESSANRARNAHIRMMASAGGGASVWLSAAPSSRHEGARRARFIRWIPACAGMARWGHGNGGVGLIRWMPIGFLHSLKSRNPAQIERGTRTLQNLTACPSLHGIFLQRSARRARSMRDSGFRRNDMEEVGMTWRRPE